MVNCVNKGFVILIFIRVCEIHFHILFVFCHENRKFSIYINSKVGVISGVLVAIQIVDSINNIILSHFFFVILDQNINGSINKEILNLTFI